MKKNCLLIALGISIMGVQGIVFPKPIKAAKVPWGGVAWKIVQKASNKAYNVKASISKGKYGVTSTPGTITLNGSKYGASAMYNVKSLSTKHSLAMFANSDPISMMLKKYSLLVINPKGHYTVNTSINPGVYRGFKFGLKGTYKVQFVSNTKFKLAPYVAYRYDSANSIYKTNSLVDSTNNQGQNDSDTIQSDSQINGGQTVNDLPYGDLIKPSWGSGVVSTPTSSQLTVGQLYDQFEDNDHAVYSMKSYVVGDTIHVHDQVSSLNYDNATNSTQVYFASNSNDFLEFNGDLTHTIKVGDTFDKNMKVEQMGNNNEFRIPDYFKYVIDHNGEYPNF